MIETLKEMMKEYAQIGDQEITRDTRLTADLGLKSMDMLNILCILEEKFSLEFPEDQLRSFATVGDIADYLEAHGPQGKK